MMLNMNLSQHTLLITHKTGISLITQQLLSRFGDNALAFLFFSFVDGFVGSGGDCFEDKLLADVVDRVDFELYGAVREFTVSNG